MAIKFGGINISKEFAKDDYDHSSITEIVYKLLCESCNDKDKCHDLTISFANLHKCASNRLVAKSKEELHDIELINNVVEELKAYQLIQNVDINYNTSASIYVTMTDDKFINKAIHKTIYTLEYNKLRELKSNIDFDIIINTVEE